MYINFCKITIKNKNNNLVFIFAFIAFLTLLSLQKTSLGNDERYYVQAGLNYLSTLEYHSTKYLPLPSILLGSLSTAFSSDLLATRVIYVVSIILIVSAAYLFSKTHFPECNSKLTALFICSFPGIIYLNLYSVVNLFAVALQVYAIYFLSTYFKKNKIIFLVLFSIICGAAYLTRVDTLILYSSGLLLLLIQKYRLLSFFEVSKLIILSVIIFFFVIMHWQFYLFNNGLIFSQGVSAGAATWPNGIWPLMVETSTNNNFNLYFGNSTEGRFSLIRTIDNLNLILNNIGLNLLQYLKAISSPQLIPFFNYVNLGIFLSSRIKIPWQASPIFLPFLFPFFYMGYGGPFSVERYLTLLIFPIGVLASLVRGPFQLENFRVKLIVIGLLINLTLSIGGLLIGNRTYM